MRLDATGQAPISAQLAGLQAQNLEVPKPGGDSAQTARDFEALLATMLVKEMRSTLSEGFFGSGPGADTFGGWLDKTIGDSLADTWDVDLAGMVKTSLDSKQAQLDQLNAAAGNSTR
jgi:Rod binding domain-containing protein